MPVIAENSEGELEQAKPSVPLWRNRDYLFLWSGQSISRMGSGISQLAFPLLILTLTGSAAQAGVIGALEIIPQLAFGLIAGALVDRWNRKWVMIVCDIGRAVILAGLALALAFRSLPVQLLYFLVPLEGSFAVFFDLAAASRLPHVVTKEQLPAAVAQNQTALAVTSLLSPSIAGVLYNLMNSLPFVADAISYVVSVCTLCFIKTNFQRERTVGPLQLRTEIKDGILWLWRQPVARMLSLLIGGVGFVAGGHTLFLIVLAQKYHTSPAGIGLMFTIAGIGSIIGSQLAPLIQQRLRFGWVTIIGCWAFAVIWPLYALVSTPLEVGIVFAGLAFMSVILDVGLFSYILVLIPDELRGRVNSITNLILLVSRSAGITLTGFFLQRLGTLTTLLFFWGCLVLVALIAIFSRDLRMANSLGEG